MKPDRKVEAEKIDIISITTLKGNINCDNEVDSTKIDAHQFSFKLNSGFKIEQHLAAIKLVTDILAMDKQGEELPITGSYTHEMVFLVENLEDFVEESDEGKMIDAVLGSILVGILYSTVRGIIYSRTQGTSLGVVTLPVIAPLELMGIDAEDEQVKKHKKKKQKQ